MLFQWVWSWRVCEEEGRREMEEERKKWGREGGSGESAGSWVEGVGEVVKLEV